MTLRCALWAVLACCGALASAGCDSDMSPSDVALEGTWNGTWQYVTAGVTVTDTVTAELTRSGATSTGTWAAQSGPSGNVTLMAGAPLTGTLTINQTTITGQTCSATTNISGTATASTIEFTTAEIPPSGICQWATSNRFSFRR
jgi:hypothetical protein